MLGACDEWRHVWPELAFLMYKSMDTWSSYQFEIQKVWDDRVSRRFPRTSVADLADFHAMYPLAEPEMVLESMLSDLDHWGALRDDLDQLNSTICVNLEAGYKPNQPDHHGQALEVANVSESLQHRFIQPDISGSMRGRIHDPNGEIPTLGTIFEGIRLGQYIRTIATYTNFGTRRSYLSLCQMDLLQSGWRTNARVRCISETRQR